MESNPKELNPYDLAHQKRIKEQDALMHAWWGKYGLSAVSVAVEHCLAGRKAKLSYIETPILSNIEQEIKDNFLSQEELDNRELQKMIFAEEMWIKNDKRRGLRETIIK